MSEQLWEALCRMSRHEPDRWGVSAQELADTLQQHRSNVSRELNRLVKQGSVEKKDRRPVLFRTTNKRASGADFKPLTADGFAKRAKRVALCCTTGRGVRRSYNIL